MRVAYLITAYGEWAHLERLVAALDAPARETDEPPSQEPAGAPQVGFFIHIDARSRVPEGLAERLAARGNVTFAPRRAVWWGGWSHTAAILSLMELAVAAEGRKPGADGEVTEDAGYDYCVLLSGADYPVRSNRVIFDTLAAGGEFINAAPGFRPAKPESRVRYFHFDGFDRRSHSPRALLMKAMEWLLRALGIRRRRYPFARVWSGVVWGALSGPCVRYIVEYARAHPRYVRFFRRALVPEEMFFHTIIAGSPFAADIRGTLTYMDWRGDGASPPFLTREHLPLLAPGVAHFNPPTGRTYERLFARKFRDSSGALLDEIDAWRVRAGR